MIKNALALLAALAALAGCALSPPSVPTPAAPSPRLGGAISFAAPAADRAYYQPLIAAFEATHPRARVVFVEADALGAGAGMPQGGLRAMAQAADTGVGSVAPEDVASGTVLDLRPLLLADASFDRADYYPRALAPLSGDASGGIYALPSTVAAPVLAADPLLADQAGVPLPPPDRPSTWAAVLAIAQGVAATSSPGRQVFGIMADDLGFAAFIGDVERRSPTALGIPLRLGDAALADALGAARVRAEAGITWQPESMAGSPDQAAADLVAQHRLGMWNASYQSPALAQADARYFPAPETSFPAALPAQQGLFISAGTSSPQLAWQWLVFLSAQLPPEHVRPGGGAVYARRSLNVQARVWDAVPAQRAQAMRAALEQVPQRRATSEREWAALHGAWEQAARRHIPPAQALADAAQALAAASAAPTAARQPPAVPSPAPIQPAQEIIRFGANEDETRLRPLLRQFERDHPSIKVAFTPLDVFAGDQAARMFATVARQQDCFSWPTPPPPALRSAVLDLQPLMAADAAFDAGDYPAALLVRVADHGRITALPFMLRLRAMGYNAVLAPDLDRAALSSFAGFADAARQYTATGGPSPRYGYAMRYGPPEDLSYVLGQAGASISRASPEGLQPDFLHPSAVRGIRAYIDLLRSASPYRALPGYHGGESQQGYITTGQSVFWTTFDVAGVTFGQIDLGVFEPHVLPLPRDAGRGSSDDMRISTLAIAKGTAHADACWQLLKALGAAPSLLSGGQFPARVSVAQSSAFRAQATPEALAVYEAYRAALARPGTSGAAGLFDDPAFDPYWLYEAVDAALAGDNLEQALERAQDTTAAYLACVRAGGEGGTCAARVDPTYQGIGPIGPR